MEKTESSGEPSQEELEHPDSLLSSSSRDALQASLGSVWILMKQMVDAAIDLQNKEIFHRDLKCENTLVEMGSQEPCIRIVGLGFGSFQRTTVYRSFSGAFAPPEWFSCRKYRPSPTMVWQLGIILYQMLHRCHFDTRLFTRGQIKFNKNIWQECLNVLHQCLEENNRKRFIPGSCD